MRLLVDGPSILWRCLSVGRDPEAIKAKDPENPDKDYWINTAGYGVENALTLMHSALNRFAAAPKDVVLVWESKNPHRARTSRAKGIEYKGSRGKRPARAYAEYQEAQRQLTEFFLELGGAACTQEGVEADDILAFLATHSEEPCTVLTHDGDLARLVGPNPKGVFVHVGNNDWLDANPYGPFPNSLITVYKALVGDSSDGIKGAPGFGDKSFLKLLGTYGVQGLTQIEDLIVARQLPNLHELADADKGVRRICDHEQAVYTSHVLAQLYPQDVDTKSQPLQWFYGMVRDVRLTDDLRYRQWYGTRTLVHAENFKHVVGWAKKQLGDYVALDLETTTCEESDAWMAERKKRDDEAGIDVFGQEIVSCGLTFGDNNQHTIYLTHRHDPSDGTPQLTLQQLGSAIHALCQGRRVVCHNAGGFELPVLRNHFDFGGDDLGFLSNMHCTKLLASYVNENVPSGLKPSAKHYFGYDQQTFAEVTGGRKMDQLTATHVFRYGTDDTIVTAALYNHLSFRCQTEDTWSVYCEVEQAPMYLQAAAFLQGIPISMQRMREIEEEDNAAYQKGWVELRDWLISQGWAGTVCPTFTAQVNAAEIKTAYEIVTGEPLVTKTRTPRKLVALIRDLEDAPPQAEIFATMLERCLDGDASPLNELVKSHFSGEPVFNLGSPKQMQHLMYEVMKLPVRVRNKPTDAMRANGIREGSAKTDELSIKAALHFDKGGPYPDILRALLALKTVETRRKMFYNPYRHVEHWRDRLVHASFNQCATVTRRYTCNGPNLQQLPKKDEGLKFRELILPHKRGAVVVSMDFSGQELRLMAEESRDPEMLACYVGENLKDLHSITGAAISKTILGRTLTYDELVELEAAGHPDGKRGRAMGKKTNFTLQYGAMAPKLALTLLIEEAPAQDIIDARSAVFHVSEKWKDSYVEECRRLGYATTRMGARRHLRAAFASDDFRVAGKAERQGPNFKIQGSGAEMTKLAMKEMWKRRIFEMFDAVPYGPVHDEYVASCSLEDLPAFLKEMHACMVRPYGNMTVPIVSSISFGPNFGVQIEIGDEPTDEAIERGLAKYREMIKPELKQAA